MSVSFHLFDLNVLFWFLVLWNEMSSSEPEISIKICLIGPSGSGAKTSLIRRYARGSFEDVRPSYSTDFFVHNTVVDGRQVRLQLWGLFQDQ